jgi:hypothetical protein
MLDKLKSAAMAVSNLAGDALTAGVEKLKGSLDELSAASGDLEQVGYRIGQIELVASIPPRIVLFLTRLGTGTTEAYQAILARHANNTTLRTVVSMLQLGDKLIERVPLKGRRCTQLVVELSVPPTVRLVYDPVPGGPT